MGSSFICSHGGFIGHSWVHLPSNRPRTQFFLAFCFSFDDSRKSSNLGATLKHIAWNSKQPSKFILFLRMTRGIKERKYSRLSLGILLLLRKWNCRRMEKAYHRLGTEFFAFNKKWNCWGCPSFRINLASDSENFPSENLLSCRVFVTLIFCEYVLLSADASFFSPEVIFHENILGGGVLKFSQSCQYLKFWTNLNFSKDWKFKQVSNVKTK